LGLPVLLGLVLVFFPWDVLRGPVSRVVSARIDRHFEITHHLDLQLGRRLTVRAEGVVMGNPDWAREPSLLEAESAEMELRWWPLLTGRIDIPRLSLRQPVLGLERHPDGRRSWALSGDGKGQAPAIGELLVNRGRLGYLAPAQGVDIVADFALRAEEPGALPLTFRARGRYRDLPFTAQGRTGGVLQLHENQRGPFPVQLQATAGQTRLKAEGSVTQLASVEALNLNVEVQGPSLRELDRLVDAVLPATRPYRLTTHLQKTGEVWRMQALQGALGRTDMTGSLVFDRSGPTPLLRGQLKSRRLDFDDLGPLIGASPSGAAAASTGAGQPPEAERKAQQKQGRPGKVLPASPMDFARLSRMNADISFSAGEVRNARGLSLERVQAGVMLDQGALRLSPLVLGVAGGEMRGQLVLSGQGDAAQVALRLDTRALQLNRLFPRIEQTRSSLGKVSGSLDLQGRGNSVAAWLGSASGELGFLMGRGQISNILLEFLGLDGGEIIKFLVRGDQNIRLRCAALAFGMERGVMSSRVLLLDTVVRGQGQINLADETLNLVLAPEPKDPSIFSVRSPLRIGGTLAAPEVGPDTGALAGRTGLAIALGVINPLLALAATVETGPGEDANCAQALETARQSGGQTGERREAVSSGRRSNADQPAR
jgi:uncharacterized protein involved in outer membrane biogenesis